MMILAAACGNNRGKGRLFGRPSRPLSLSGWHDCNTASYESRFPSCHVFVELTLRGTVPYDPKCLRNLPGGTGSRGTVRVHGV